MYRQLATLIAKTGLTAGIALLLTLAALMPSATRASADDCPEGTAPISDVDGNSQCVTVSEGESSSEPTATPTPPPTPSPTPAPAPTDLPPPTGTPGTAPPEPAPTAGPESAPAVILPPPVTEPAAPEAPPTEPPAPATTPVPNPTPIERPQTPDQTEDTGTPAPAVVPPEPPANADTTGVIVPGDGPRLLWAVAAGASASGLLAALVAFYLVSVRPFFTARRRPGAFG